MAEYYVRNWGNDDNDGLSEATAWRTLSSAHNMPGRVVNAVGFYFEHNLLVCPKCNKIGDCVINANGHDMFLSGLGTYDICNVVFKNFNKIAGGRLRWNINNCMVVNGHSYRDYTGNHKAAFNSVFFNVSVVELSAECINNTIMNCDIRLNVSGYYSAANNVFSESKLSGKISVMRNSLFINSQFKFTSGGQGADETGYTYPVGSTDRDKLVNLRQRMACVYGGNVNDYLEGCRYYSGNYNDIFVDADNGNFDLVEGCIATYMSYEGSHIGARPVGKQIAIQDCTLTNIDTDGNIIDQTVNAQAISHIRRIGYKAEITSINLIANLAHRNGQRANTERILGEEIQAGSNVLTAGKVYECYNGDIVIDNTNNTILQSFEGYTAVDEGNGAGLGFSGNGVMREVKIENSKPKMQFKFSKNDATLASANLITLYIHEIPMVNLNSQAEPEYGNADDGFDADNAVPLVADYYQVFVEIQANDLTSR